MSIVFLFAYLLYIYIIYYNTTIYILVPTCLYLRMFFHPKIVGKNIENN